MLPEFPNTTSIAVIAQSGHTTVLALNGRLYFSGSHCSGDARLFPVQSKLIAELFLRFNDHQVVVEVRRPECLDQQSLLFVTIDNRIVIGDAPPTASDAELASLFLEFEDVTGLALDSSMVVRDPLPDAPRG